MAGTMYLNPHEAPPQELKDVFKLWKGPLVPDREQILNAIVDNMRRVDSIPHHRLNEIFTKFSPLGKVGKGEDPTEREQVALEDSLSAYNSQNIPGLVILPSLFPPATQKRLLSHLLHRDLCDPNHKTNLHLHYHVKYPDQKASFFSSHPSTVTFQPKDPGIHPSLTIQTALEKKLRWTTLGGQYDWTNKAYPDEEPPKFPSDIAELIGDMFPSMKPEAAIVNLYSPGDTLSLHRDVSEEVDRGLVSVSLGCDAIFIIGLQDKTTGKTSFDVLRLRSGDAVYMSGKSRFAWHGVPKIVAGTCPEYLADWPGNDFPEWRNWMSSKRVNLNVRQMHGR